MGTHSDGKPLTFAGFDGPYWEKKAFRAAMAELTALAEEQGWYDDELDDEDGNYYCEQCHDWHGPDWDED